MIKKIKNLLTEVLDELEKSAASPEDMIIVNADQLAAAAQAHGVPVPPSSRLWKPLDAIGATPSVDTRKPLYSDFKWG